MSCILKITYHHKHKKYRYHADKPVNFHQIRQQLAIHHPLSSLKYHITTHNHSHLAPEPHQLNSEQLLNEQQLLQHLKNLPIDSTETIKINIVSKNQPELGQGLSEVHSQEQDICAPAQMEKLRSRSEQIDLTKVVGERTDNLQITQEFLCNSQIELLKIQKSKQSEQLQKELVLNARRLKLSLEKRQYTDISKLLNYLEYVTAQDL